LVREGEDIKKRGFAPLKHPKQDNERVYIIIQHLWYNRVMKHGLKVLIEHYKSKEHWYVKYLIWSIVSIVCFAILIQIFKEVGFLPAQKIFDFLNQWAMVLSASATLLLAFTAFWAIMDNRHGRIVDRRERLLKEVIDWATDILICGRDISRELFKEIAGGSTSKRAAGIELEAKFNVISWRGVYIRHISSNLNKALYDSVLDTQRILRQHGKIMGLDFKSKIKNASALGKHRDTLDDSAKLIIEIAVSLLSNKTSSPS
jgi:hypothetical protein